MIDTLDKLPDFAPTEQQQWQPDEGAGLYVAQRANPGRRIESPFLRHITTQLPVESTKYNKIEYLSVRMKGAPCAPCAANYPHLPMAEVKTTQAADYMTLLAEACA